MQRVRISLASGYEMATAGWAFIKRHLDLSEHGRFTVLRPDSGIFTKTVISHDKDSTMDGFYASTTKGVSVAPRTMSFSGNPKNPDELLSGIGFTLTKN